MLYVRMFFIYLWSSTVTPEDQAQLGFCAAAAFILRRSCLSVCCGLVDCQVAADGSSARGCAMLRSVRAYVCVCGRPGVTSMPLSQDAWVVRI